ncbi:MAG: class II fructose-bisphosphate aldolase, partial [Candidatus Brocadiia bacterium]|nr:class II fructose-bisphosphate aldolase [Candidatus Brocadiia bacterium]
RGVIGIPLVLHGGSSVRRKDVLAAVKKGIAKINIGTEIRQAYETGLREGGGIAAAQEATYERTGWILTDYLGQKGMRARVVPKA